MVVAEDKPDNLTARLRGAETVSLQIDAGSADPASALLAVDGVTSVTVNSQDSGVVSAEVETVQGRDLRRDLARTVVTNGWGLLELKSMRMSLEEIFLDLTTEEIEPEHENPDWKNTDQAESGTTNA